MRISVDRTKCTGLGICESLAPEVFEVDDDGVLRVTREEVAAEDEQALRDVIASCPTRALSLQ